MSYTLYDVDIKQAYDNVYRMQAPIHIYMCGYLMKLDVLSGLLLNALK